MIHKMRLKDKEFYNIVNNNKRIEVRLNDAKRQKIKSGDKIIFHNISEPENVITVTVTEVFHFTKFVELYNNFSSEFFGYDNMSVDEMISNIYSFYTEEQETLYGVIGIKFIVQLNIT